MTFDDYKELSDSELLELYCSTIKELKARNIIRTKNVLGDLGEHLAVQYYCNNSKLQNLATAPTGTQNIDAIDRKGCRYSIKSTSQGTTSVFYGLNEKGSTEKEEQKFEYVIICHFDDDFILKAIYELSWDIFLKHKKWHSRMRAWNLSVTKNLIDDSKIIYQKE